METDVFLSNKNYAQMRRLRALWRLSSFNNQPLEDYGVPGLAGTQLVDWGNIGCIELFSVISVATSRYLNLKLHLDVLMEYMSAKVFVAEAVMPVIIFQLPTERR